MSDDNWTTWATALVGREMPAHELRDAISDEIQDLRAMFDARWRAMFVATAAGQPFDVSGLTARGAAELLAALTEVQARLEAIRDN